MGKRLVRWFTYGIAFALLPLLASVLIHFFLGKMSFDTVSRSPEILFFSLMVNATALAELSELGKVKVHDALVSGLSSALLLGVVMSAMLYGAFLFATVAESVKPDFAWRVFLVSLGLALVSFFIATASQIFLGKIGK
jgi:hypothetical protein